MLQPPTGTPLRTSTVGVSIPIPEPHGTLLRAKRAEYGDPLAAFVPAHVTLMGPTDVEHGDLDAMVEHLADVARRHAPFEMELGGTGTFRPVSSVVFVKVVRGGQSCALLEEAIRTDAYHRDLAFDYHPHVTVAHHVDEERLDHAAADLAGFGAVFRVADFWLYEQDTAGAWVPVRRFAMTGTG